MNNKNNKYALTAGITLLIMALAAFYTYGYVYNSLIDPLSPGETLDNLLNSSGLFLSGLIMWFVIIITDLTVTWTLYVFLKDIDNKLSLLAALFRFIYTVMLTIAVFKLCKIYYLIDTDLTATVAIDLSNSFNRIWSLGLIVFGVHLLFLGFTSLKTTSIPAIFKILLIVAGGGYLITNILYNFLPSLHSFTKILEMILVVPMTVGELGFAVWLIVKGRNIKSFKH